MEGKEAIVGKILSDAQQKADAIVVEARERAAAMKAEAERAANESLAEWRRALERESTEVVARRETVASLDNRKAMLAAKRAVIDEVLARALASACALPKERYCSLVERLLEEYAQEGDAVTLSASAPLGEKELAACKAFSAKKLRYAGTGEFEGGLRLENATYLTDLSFRAILDARREELEQSIASAVFPAEK